MQEQTKITKKKIHGFYLAKKEKLLDKFQLLIVNGMINNYGKYSNLIKVH